MRNFVLLVALAVSGTAAAQQRAAFDLGFVPRVIERACVIGPRGVQRCTTVTTPAAASVALTGPLGNGLSVTFGGMPIVTPPVRTPRPTKTRLRQPATVLLVPVHPRHADVVSPPPLLNAQHPCPDVRGPAARTTTRRVTTVRR